MEDMWVFQFRQLDHLYRGFGDQLHQMLCGVFVERNQWSSLRKKSVICEVIRQYLAKQKMWKSLRVACHATNKRIVTWELGQSPVPDVFCVMRRDWRFEANLAPSTNFFEVWFKIFITIVAPDITGMSVTKETLHFLCRTMSVSGHLFSGLIDTYH